MPVLQQSGVVPYRLKGEKIEVLLITSSRRKRWGIPKGWIEPFMTAADSAAKEAWEEAGVLGSVMTPAIGAYHYRKWGLPCRVEVFLMQVETVLEDWNEAKVRDREWMSVAKATKRIKDTELQQIIGTLQIPDTTISQRS